MFNEEGPPITLQDINAANLPDFFHNRQAILIDGNGIDSSFWRLGDWGINRYHPSQEFALKDIKYYEFVMNEAASKQGSFTAAKSAGCVLKVEPIQSVIQDSSGIIYAVKKFVSGQGYHSGEDKELDKLLFQFSDFMNLNIGCMGIDVTPDNIRKQQIFLGSAAANIYIITDLCKSIKALKPKV